MLRQDRPRTAFAFAWNRPGSARAIARVDCGDAGELEGNRDAAAELGDDAALEMAETAARQAAELARETLADAMQTESRLAETVRAAGDRLATCNAEAAQWGERRQGAAARVDQMKERLTAAEEEQQALAARPDELGHAAARDRRPPGCRRNGTPRGFGCAADGRKPRSPRRKRHSAPPTRR